MSQPDIYTRMMTVKCIEPVRRMVGGRGPRWAVHRFPIKGGITGLAAMHSDFIDPLFRPSTLWRKLEETAPSNKEVRVCP